MAITLQFNLNGTTAIADFSGGTNNGRVFGFQLQPPGQDGTAEQNVDCYWDNGQGARAGITALQAVFKRARTDSLGDRNRLYCRFKQVGSDTLHETEVLDGEIIPLDGAFASWELAGAQRFTLRFRHRGWWRPTTSSSPNINNIGATPASYLTVYNEYNGTTRDNTVYLNAAWGGDQFAPLGLYVTNNNATDLRTVWVGILRGSPGYDHRPTLATGGSGTASGLSPITLGTWTVSQNQLTTAAGRLFKPMLRLNATLGVSDVEMRWSVSYSSGILFRSGWQRLRNGDQMHEFDAFALPPRYLASAPRAVTITCEARKASGSQALTVTDLNFLPVSDGFKRYRWTTFKAANTHILYDLPETGELYTYTGASGNIVGSISAAPIEPLRLAPSEQSLLMFLHDLSDGTAPASANIRVQLVGRNYRTTI